MSTAIPLINPLALSTVEELRAALAATNDRLEELANHRQLLAVVCNCMAGDLAAIAKAHNDGDQERLHTLLARVTFFNQSPGKPH